MNQETGKKWVINVIGWPEELIAQAPSDVVLNLQPQDTKVQAIRSLRGFVCHPSGPIDYSGNILMDVGLIKWGDASVFTQWVIESVDGGYRCDWESFKEVLASLEKS